MKCIQTYVGNPYAIKINYKDRRCESVDSKMIGPRKDSDHKHFLNVGDKTPSSTAAQNMNNFSLALNLPFPLA
jgi:hypothetical protein